MIASDPIAPIVAPPIRRDVDRQRRKSPKRESSVSSKTWSALLLRSKLIAIYAFLNWARRFSVNAAMPSFWSCVAKREWNVRRS